MKIIIDTHIFLWALADPSRIPAEKKSELVNLANTIFVSSITLAEIMIKASLGKLVVDFDPISATEETGFQLLNFTAADACQLKDMPFHLKDPFDRMLIAQSIAQRTGIMSNDIKFSLYDCKVI